MPDLSLLLIGALLLLVSITLTPLSARVGIPVLLLFLGVGMMAGEDGLGGIQFADAQITFIAANLALAVILLDGGMRTRITTFRVGLKPALSLATIGVMVTAGLTGLAAHWLLELPPLTALLMGAIVASTDAAAVFSLLQGRGLHLNERVGATLEIESGSNDPMAIFLTLLMLQLIERGLTYPDLSALWLLLSQFGLGFAAGWLGGELLSTLLKRLQLPLGLYPLLVFTGGIALFAATSALGGSGFVAVYLAGLVLSYRRPPMLNGVLQVHDGLAWLAQLSLFLMLGLLVTPSAMLPLALPSLGVALILILIARPLAVWLCLWPFDLSARQRTFISWVGLRGAVPIVLALFPVLAEINHAQLLFNATFFIVLVSLLLQGTTLAPMARWLKLEVPAPREPARRIPLNLGEGWDQELYLLQVRELGLDPLPSASKLKMPNGANLLAVFRQSQALSSQDAGALQPEDWLAISAGTNQASSLAKLLAIQATTPQRQQVRLFFGDFTLSGTTLLQDIATSYGVPVAPEHAQLTLAQYFREIHPHPVVGDESVLGPLRLVIREVEGDKVVKVGLKLPGAI